VILATASSGVASVRSRAVRKRRRSHVKTSPAGGSSAKSDTTRHALLRERGQHPAGARLRGTLDEWHGQPECSDPAAVGVQQGDAGPVRHLHDRVRCEGRVTSLGVYREGC